MCDLSVVSPSRSMSPLGGEDVASGEGVLGGRDWDWMGFCGQSAAVCVVIPTTDTTGGDLFAELNVVLKPWSPLEILAGFYNNIVEL